MELVEQCYRFHHSLILSKNSCPQFDGLQNLIDQVQLMNISQPVSSKSSKIQTSNKAEKIYLCNYEINSSQRIQLAPPSISFLYSYHALITDISNIDADLKSLNRTLLRDLDKLYLSYTCFILKDKNYFLTCF